MKGESQSLINDEQSQSSPIQATHPQIQTISYYQLLVGQLIINFGSVLYKLLN